VQEPPPGAPQPPRAGDVAPYVEDERPATLADIRSLRRWLAVAAVWAVAATALGVIALLKANEDDSAQQTAAAGELGRVQRQLNSRMDDLEARVEELPTNDAVAKLDGRLKSVEDDADKSRADAAKLSGRVDDLEGRVDDLESRVEELESSDSGTTTTP
jgi:polyhydroxyalkanoate synthesis regulator phasin